MQLLSYLLWHIDSPFSSCFLLPQLIFFFVCVYRPTFTFTFTFTFGKVSFLFKQNLWPERKKLWWKKKRSRTFCFCFVLMFFVTKLIFPWQSFAVLNLSVNTTTNRHYFNNSQHNTTEYNNEIAKRWLRFPSVIFTLRRTAEIPFILGCVQTPRTTRKANRETVWG